jgi:hypothetical protein
VRTERQLTFNQAKVKANPQDDFQKQKNNKKSGNSHQVIIIPVENKLPEGYLGSIIRGLNSQIY